MFSLLAHKHLKGGCIISQLQSEFPGYGIGLIPQVLTCINTYAEGSSKRRGLSVLFDLIRNWKMPEIFQRSAKPSSHCEVSTLVNVHLTQMFRRSEIQSIC